MAILLCGEAFGQHWATIDMPTEVLDWGDFYLDTTSQTLYATGINQILPGQSGIFRTQGAVWDTIGYFGNAVFSVIIHHDTLIAGGA